MSSGANLTEVAKRTKLTKADILNGRFARCEDVPVPDWDHATVTLWALTEGQWAEVEATRLRGFDMSVGGIEMSGQQTQEGMMEQAAASMRFDMEKMTLAEAEADALAVAYSLSGGHDQWTLEEVKAMRPPAVVSYLAQNVYRISNVTPEDLKALRTFRNKR